MTEWIMAISSSITALTVVILWKQVTANHELARRERAISLIQFWATNLSQKKSAARNFAEVLDFEQSKCLFNRESFAVDARHKHLLQSFFGDLLEIKDKQIMLGVNEVSELKSKLVDFLNILESILSAWRHNVADQDIIYEEFHFLILPEEGHDILRFFRKAAGGKAACPSIEEFVRFVENKLSQKKKGKSVIV